jgi:hypothetical protein
VAEACRECEKRPSGLEGHDQLALATHIKSPTGRYLYHCVACQRYWRREYEGSGLFVWFEQPNPMPDP